VNRRERELLRQLRALHSTDLLMAAAEAAAVSGAAAGAGPGTGEDALTLRSVRFVDASGAPLRRSSEERAPLGIGRRFGSDDEHSLFCVFVCIRTTYEVKKMSEVVRLSTIAHLWLFGIVFADLSASERDQALKKYDNKLRDLRTLVETVIHVVFGTGNNSSDPADWEQVAEARLAARRAKAGAAAAAAGPAGNGKRREIPDWLKAMVRNQKIGDYCGSLFMSTYICDLRSRSAVLWYKVQWLIYIYLIYIALYLLFNVCMYMYMYMCVQAVRVWSWQGRTARVSVKTS